MLYWKLQILLLASLACILWALLAVSCHRVLLEDESAPTVLDGVRLGRRQIKYILMTLVVVSPIFIWGVLNQIVGRLWNAYTGDDDISPLLELAFEWVFLIPTQYFSSRIALTLPAAALQRPLSFARAWSLSKGNGWRITAVLLAGPAVVDVVYLLVDSTLSAYPILDAIFWTFFSLLIGIYVIGALSFTYKWITNEK